MGTNVIVFTTTFNNISVITWRSVLLVEETGVPGEKHRPVSSRWQTLAHLLYWVNLAWAGFELNVSGDRHWLHYVLINPTTIRSRRLHLRNKASLHRNSLTDDRITARPSPCLEYGVFPEPFNCSSNLSPFWFIYSPEDTVLPGKNHRPVASHWQTITLCCIEYTSPERVSATIRSRPRWPLFIYKYSKVVTHRITIQIVKL
jgi:hypothetical protein